MAYPRLDLLEVISRQSDELDTGAIKRLQQVLLLREHLSSITGFQFIIRQATYQY